MSSPQRGILIGLGGKAGAGKDAAADILSSGYGFVKMGMSDPLNEALLKLDPLVPRRWRRAERYSALHARVGYVKAKKNREVRRLLLTLGTDVVRNMIAEDTWIKIASARIEELLAEGVNVAITGMRFFNEIDMVRSLGGTLVYVNRPDQNLIDETNGVHEAEQSVGPIFFDQNLDNIGTLLDLNVAVARLYAKLFDAVLEKRHKI